MPFGLMLVPLAVIAAGAGLGAALNVYATRRGVDPRKYARVSRVTFIVLIATAGLLGFLLLGVLLLLLH